MNKKIAYLLLVHDFLENVIKLINKLNAADTQFYIHVDKKVDITPYIEALKKDNVLFVENRIDVRWAGYTQNEAVLRLFEMARAGDNDYYILLSGHDYPVYNTPGILERIDLTKDYYSVWNYDIFKVLKQKARLRYAKYHFNDISFLNPKYNPKNKVVKGLSKGAYYFSRFLLYSLPDRKYKFDFVLCKGSTWMSLTRDTLDKLLNWMNNGKNYPIIKYLKHSSSSDEVLFHSILYNLGIEARDVSEDPNVLGLHYVKWDWLVTKKPNVLEEKDFDAIIASKALFARKIDKGVSDKLVEKLDTCVEH